MEDRPRERLLRRGGSLRRKEAAKKSAPIKIRAKPGRLVEANILCTMARKRRVPPLAVQSTDQDSCSSTALSRSEKLSFFSVKREEHWGSSVRSRGNKKLPTTTRQKLLSSLSAEKHSMRGEADRPPPHPDCSVPMREHGYFCSVEEAGVVTLRRMGPPPHRGAAHAGACAACGPPFTAVAPGHQLTRDRHRKLRRLLRRTVHDDVLGGWPLLPPSVFPTTTVSLLRPSWSSRRPPNPAAACGLFG